MIRLCRSSSRRSTLRTTMFNSKHNFSVFSVVDGSSPLRLKWPHVSFVCCFIVDFSIHPPVIGGAWFKTSRQVIHITIAGDFLPVLGWSQCCFCNCRLIRAKIHVMSRGMTAFLSDFERKLKAKSYWEITLGQEALMCGEGIFDITLYFLNSFKRLVIKGLIHIITAAKAFSRFS